MVSTTVRSTSRSEMRDWTVERPAYALLLAIAGSTFVAVGYLVFDWAAGADFGAVRRAVGSEGDSFNVATQLYVRAAYLPLLVAAVVVGLLATVDRVAARIAIGAAGLLGGAALVAAVVWAELGGLGSADARKQALPALALTALAGVACFTAGIGAVFDRRSVYARSLAAGLAGAAVVLHTYAAVDLFDSVGDVGLGVWAVGIGYLLLVVAPALPYRRISHLV